MSSNREKWFSLLPSEAVQAANRLAERANGERTNGKCIYPEQDVIFRALDLIAPEDVRVVIVGQDPYHGPGQANGLAFAVNAGGAFPPSLRNIFKEVRDEGFGDIPENGDLLGWAKQGVLLLNTVLTVEEGQPNSHAKWGWQEFTRAVCAACAALPQPVVFLLWGGKARAFVDEIDIRTNENVAALCCSHPSPLGARKGNDAVPAFIGSDIFRKCNEQLRRLGSRPICWEQSFLDDGEF